MNLISEVTAAFSPGGILSRSTEQFVGRLGQLEMALAVATAIEQAEALVVEASTGVGKTFAYLVPALLSGERVLVSTATKALQDQLFGRDLPRLVQALGVPVSTALLKGRASYICMHRLTLARQDVGVTDRSTLLSIAKIEQWAIGTKSGDLAELPGLDERSFLVPLITSTRENCLGSQCPHFRGCHVNQARRDALAADVVVINHHLFFADLAVRESGMAELLPSLRIAIFDEAHQLNEIVIQFLGKNLTTGQLLDFSRDVLAAGLKGARGLLDWNALASLCEQATRNLRLCLPLAISGPRLSWTSQAPETTDPGMWNQSLRALADALASACEGLDTVSELGPDFVRLRERASELAQRAENFMLDCRPGYVRWLEIGAQIRLVESPLNIAHAVKSRLLEAPGGSAKSWVFTSATLGDDEKLSWFTKPCGLEDARVLRVGSPFDYASQAALYIPENIPKAGDPAHTQKVAEHVAEWASQIGGRTMVLTTTLRALRLIGQTLRHSFADSGAIEILVQGEMPKRVLIDRFRQGSSNGKPGCILVASASFWEGIDIPGDALQLLVIDKLPFPPPNDPMAEARSRELEAKGLSAFNDYFLPEAAVALKQGTGRLIRRETDQGILVVCDIRLHSMGYGKRLIRALPPMERIATREDFLKRLRQLTRTCTTDYPPL